MSTITAQEYEGIIKFIHYINKDYTNFIPNVLYAFAEFCHFPLSVYTIFSNDGRARDQVVVERIESNHIYMEGLENYQRGMFRTDIFVEKGDHMEQGRNQRSVLTIPDVATYEEFYATDYGRYLRAINTPYQAVMRAGYTYVPVHVLNAYKTAEEGEFTDHELEILGHVGRAFTKAVAGYKRFLANYTYSHFLDVETEKNGQGMAVIDDGDRIVYQNGNFMPMVTYLLGTTSQFAAVKALYVTIAANSPCTAAELSDPLTLQMDQWEITFHPQAIHNGETMKKYLFVTVRRSRADAGKEAAPVGEGTFQRYGMTLRESEVAELLVRGLENAQIADQLCINITTVKFHIKNIFSKLEVVSRSAAIAKLLSDDSGGK